MTSTTRRNVLASCGKGLVAACLAPLIFRWPFFRWTPRPEEGSWPQQTKELLLAATECERGDGLMFALLTLSACPPGSTLWPRPTCSPSAATMAWANHYAKEFRPCGPLQLCGGLTTTCRDKRMPYVSYDQVRFLGMHPTHGNLVIVHGWTYVHVYHSDHHHHFFMHDPAQRTECLQTLTRVRAQMPTLQIYCDVVSKLVRERGQNIFHTPGTVTRAAPAGVLSAFPEMVT